MWTDHRGDRQQLGALHTQCGDLVADSCKYDANEHYADANQTRADGQQTETLRLREMCAAAYMHHI